MKDLKAIATGTHGVYERNAVQFDQERTKRLFERSWLEKFEELLPENASILDVGCGTGEPIARYFIEKEYDLTGVDYAQSMITLVGRRFPEQRWHQADMRELDMGRRYDGLLGWHSFFHLSREEQRAVLPCFSRHLNPGGVLLLTVGPEEGECGGHVAGQDVYHASLSPEEYRNILEKLDFKIEDFVFEDPECGFATILLARKRD
ncbi:class I SAM-dependent DNA methyltransferase [Pseudodesulfovibrio karagichevae]|uniref:Class I SAM-dependent methyltransferase n=1 Tax=Pseudodesulfovibrio karagichevae TaxID=3239305 RepID=A0ABV4JY89_9BACT